MTEICIVGLGNPGEQYYSTRHNIGWQVIDALAESSWSMEKKVHAAVLRTTLADTHVMLVKPQTFMNNSGTAVQAVRQYYKLTDEQLWLVHDEIDLPFGTVRISRGRSAAGHRGVASVLQALGTDSLVRFRLGIRPDHQFTTEDYVLQEFSAEQRSQLPVFISRATQAINRALETSPDQAAAEFN